MKNKKVAVAAGVGLLSAITIVVCSCFSEHDPAGTIYNSTESAQKDGVNFEITSSAPEDTDKDIHTEISVPDVPAAPSPEKQPKYDDPESYIIYDKSTDTYTLAKEEEKVGKESLFVGDSTCLGFSTWEVIDSKNVYATGNVGARNMLDYEMYYLSEPAKFVNVLNAVKPKHIFFWMGMNDVNMTSSEEYCENYKVIIDTALKNSDADIYICAITPISNLNFTEPAYISEFNDAIGHFVRKNYKERVYTVNFGEPLKNAEGILDEQYNGGDGIHLSRKAYYVAMHEINKQIKKTKER